MRYAVYYTPDPEGELHRLGSSWLGRDASRGVAVKGHSDPRIEQITAEPRRYGFHGTLKPPFALKAGSTFTGLQVAVRSVAGRHVSFSAGRIDVVILDRFLALVPAEPPLALSALAADCVKALDHFRAPADSVELTKRRSAGLTLRQEGHLRQWGYPYVLEDFRFHLTLTRRLTAEELAWAEPLARRHFAEILGKPLHIDALTILSEGEPGAPFHEVSRIPLAALDARAA